MRPSRTTAMDALGAPVCASTSPAALSIAARVSDARASCAESGAAGLTTAPSRTRTATMDFVGTARTRSPRGKEEPAGDYRCAPAEVKDYATTAVGTYAAFSAATF